MNLEVGFHLTLSRHVKRHLARVFFFFLDRYACVNINGFFITLNFFVQTFPVIVNL